MKRATSAAVATARRAAGCARSARLQLAREDASAFVEWAVRAEGEARPFLVQDPGHVEIQRAISEHDRVVILAPISSGKISQLAGRIAFELGRRPWLRCAYVSNGERQASKAVAAVRSIIASPEYARLFPGVRLDPREPQTATSLTRSSSQAGIPR